MKHCAQLLVCAVGVFVSSATAGAATADAGNPYADTIVGRNVFSLKTPPPPPNPEDLVKKDPPPTIELQGLTTILGRRQVLFKVKLLAKPGQPAKEESFVLTEGERQGEVEVLEIDEVAGVVKFNNHGTVEPKNMKDHVAKAPAGAPPPLALPQPGRPALPGVPPPTAGVSPAPSGPSVVTTFGGSTAIPTRALRTTTSVGGVPAGSFGAGQTTQATHTGPPMTPDEQVVMLEVLREANKDNPKFPPLPPTPLNPNPSSSTPHAPPGLPPVPQ